MNTFSTLSDHTTGSFVYRYRLIIAGDNISSPVMLKTLSSKFLSLTVDQPNPSACISPYHISTVETIFWSQSRSIYSLLFMNTSHLP
uniref:Uncharacterized protein n=1 Tax=Caldiarchaeum subterraneum TaxID=311458 RepID=E6NAV4_CALS0|nr:hypothetical protein HGMM_F15C04C09 [Candidatus Caldarchaeum subterraneum]